MENIDKILEKLMLNRTKLMLNRFDKELKDIIESDLQSFKSKDANKESNNQNNNNIMVA